MFRKTLFLFFISFSCISMFSQHEKLKHSPRRALFMSAFLPGSGQIYNRQYWKAPLYIGGMAVTGYLAYTNYHLYQNYKKAYFARTDNDPSTVDPYPFYSEQNLLDLMSFYRRNIELSVIGFTLFYALNILDAYVYAHFYDFSLQIGDESRISFRPVLAPSSAGLTIMHRFK